MDEVDALQRSLFSLLALKSTAGELFTTLNKRLRGFIVDAGVSHVQIIVQPCGSILSVETPMIVATYP